MDACSAQRGIRSYSPPTSSDPGVTSVFAIVDGVANHGRPNIVGFRAADRAEVRLEERFPLGGNRTDPAFVGVMRSVPGERAHATAISASASRPSSSPMPRNPISAGTRSVVGHAAFPCKRSVRQIESSGNLASGARSPPQLLHPERPSEAANPPLPARRASPECASKRSDRAAPSPEARSEKPAGHRTAAMFGSDSASLLVIRRRIAVASDIWSVRRVSKWKSRLSNSPLLARTRSSAWWAPLRSRPGRAMERESAADGIGPIGNASAAFLGGRGHSELLRAAGRAKSFRCRQRLPGTGPSR